MLNNINFSRDYNNQPMIVASTAFDPNDPEAKACLQEYKDNIKRWEAEAYRFPAPLSSQAKQAVDRLYNEIKDFKDRCGDKLPVTNRRYFTQIFNRIESLKAVLDTGNIFAQRPTRTSPETKKQLSAINNALAAFLSALGQAAGAIGNAGGEAIQRQLQHP